MATVDYHGRTFRPRPGETLLKMFLRQGITVPFSCGGGVCHVCMHRCTSGAVPEAARKGLRQVHRDNGFFLLCQCVPEGDMRIELPAEEMRFFQLEVMAQQSGGVLTLMPAKHLEAQAGQYLHLLMPDGRRAVAKLVLAGEGRDTIDVAIEGVGTEFPDTLAVGVMLEAQGPFEKHPEEVEQASGLDRAFPEPNAALWHRLDDGRLLSGLLRRFYYRVFRDPLLAPYFENTTEDRLAEKQYNFLRQAITGEKVYFGERPRNAHHWMVISDSVFDHRAAILLEVLREENLDEETVQALMAIEERYREDIVKSRPWNKVLFGKVLPLEGYESLVLDEACLCDGCERGLERGSEVVYHVRTGKVYCADCRA